MSVAAFLSIVASSIGSVVPARGAKVDARAANDAEVFAAAFGEATLDASITGRPASFEGSGEAPGSASSAEEAARTEATAVGSEVQVVATPVIPAASLLAPRAVPLVAANAEGVELLTPSAPPGSLPDLAQIQPADDVAPFVTSAPVAANTEDGELQASSSASSSVTSAASVASGEDVSFAGSSMPSGSITPPEAGIEDVPSSSVAVALADRSAAPTSEPERPTSIVRGEKASRLRADPLDTDFKDGSPRKSEQTPPEIVKAATPVASDRAREVASSRSAVIAPVRAAKAPEVPAANTQAVEAETETAVRSPGAVPETPTAAPLASTSGSTRFENVADRAITRAPGNGAASAEAQGAKADPDASIKSAAASAGGTASVDSSASAVTMDVAVARSPIASSAATIPAVVTEDPVAAPPLNSAPAPEAHPAETVSSSVLSTLSRSAVETTAQIAAQIVRKLEGQSTRFEMALTPEDLGRVDISLDIDADGAIHATLAFDNPVAATELRGRADELRRQLVEAGFTVGDDALSFSERDPSAGQGGAFDREADPRNARAFGAASRMNAEADTALQTPHWISLSLTPTGVDMKV